jgi:hypothetical protein
MARADFGNPQGVSTEDEHDDEQARIERARKLREAIQEIGSSGRAPRPTTPREFTEERAREAAAEERERLEGTGPDEDDDKD